MKRFHKLLIVLMIPFLMPVNGQCAEMPVLSGFKQPLSKCLKPSYNLIFTGVGAFQDSFNGIAPFEVVATTQQNADDLDITENASIHVYTNTCHLIYQQAFPLAGEVTFETIHWNDIKLLHLVTISKVGEPGDETIYNHIILAANYDGSFFPVQPPFLTSNNATSIFIGNIGAGRGFGIVETYEPTSIQTPPITSPFSFMFQLKDMPLPEGQSVTAFVGPTIIQAPPHAESGNAWPDTSYTTGFPLMHYFYGNEY